MNPLGKSLKWHPFISVTPAFRSLKGMCIPLTVIMSQL